MTAEVGRAMLALCRRGWVPVCTGGGAVTFHHPLGDENDAEAREALATLRAHRGEAVKLAAHGGALAVAAGILRSQHDSDGLAAAVAPLASMSRDDRLQVLRLLQAAMPERTGRAVVTVTGGATRAR